MEGLVEKCGADYLLAHEYPSSGLRLYIGAGDGNRVESVGRGVCIVVDRLAAGGDVEEGLLADTYASLLLASPVEVQGDRGALAGHLEAYSRRLVAEENHRLHSLLGNYLHRHALAARVGLHAARMARLARLYTWLRPLYARTLLRSPGWLHEAAQAAGLQGCLLPLASLPDRRPHRPLSIAAAKTALELALEASSLELLRAIPGEALLEGVSTPLPPPLRDPLLYVRLDSARLATRLLGFEKQLYALTGVEGALRARRKSLIRSARLVETRQGFVTAVVKHYRDLSIAKWLLAALLSLPLPQPRLRPKQRLGAEYHYNRLLAEKGYRVAEPLLLDPRRLKAAYRYIDGRNLAELLVENSVPPAYRGFGALLASLHRGGIALWDSNPSNIVLSRGGSLYLVDLEQAREVESLADMAWDIAVAVYYSIPYSLGGAAERARLLATGYIEAGGDPRAVAEASRYRYAAPFAAVVPPTVLERTRRALARAALEGGTEIPTSRAGGEGRAPAGGERWKQGEHG